MSDSIISIYGHYGTSRSGPMPQQSKFKGCVWESAKDSLNTFRTWLCIFGGIVANYTVGPQLERFLDLPVFLLRDPEAATTQPSFLNDPRLPLGDELPNGIIRGSVITRHQPRSNVRIRSVAPP